MFNNIAPNLIDVLKIMALFFIKGGWVFFAMGLIYMLYKVYRKEIEHQFVHSQKWVFLSIRVPRENMASTLAVENMFGQMHALHSGLTFAHIYVEGRTQLWYSLEIVSMGGKISFIIRTPAQTRDVVEAAVYSQYPEAEITEVADYMENFKYDPYKEGEYEIWGTEFKLQEDDVLPIKTYKDFEHPAAEEKIIDPLTQHFESLAKMAPHEFFGVQLLITPVGDDEWKPRGERKVKELIGEEAPHHASLADFFLAPLNWFANFSFLDLITGGGHGHEESTNKPINRWQFMTEAEKERVTLIERKIGKPGYRTKIKFLYIAPKDKFDATKKGMVIGSYRILGSAMTNKLKPDTGHTWTSADYRISPTLEKPYLDWSLKRKKKFIFKGYKDRNIHIGLHGHIMNIEELATMYHFPITTETRPIPAAIEATLSKKGQPPVDLPIAE